VPELGLGKERLDPHLTLAHRLLVGLSRVAGPHLLQVVRVERAMDDAAPATFCALRLEWTGTARRLFPQARSLSASRRVAASAPREPLLSSGGSLRTIREEEM
jgi:hypothetical protein